MTTWILWMWFICGAAIIFWDEITNWERVANDPFWPILALLVGIGGPLNYLLVSWMWKQDVFKFICKRHPEYRPRKEN